MTIESGQAALVAPTALVREAEAATLDDIFAQQIKDMHGIPFEEGSHRRCGRGWEIDPAYGTGTYWYYPIDGAMVIAVFDLTFSVDTTLASNAPSFLCFGSYGRNMVPYFAPFVGVTEGWDTGTLLGYAWRKGTCRNVARAGERLSVASISLLPHAAAGIARQLGVEAVELGAAISSLDGTHRIPELHRLFDEIATTTPGPPVARAYYECKIREACALVVDWHLSAERTGPRVRAADRTAYNLARSFARDHLGDRIELDDLCRASCVSATKLTRLFRDIEGDTPMGAVRMMRLEEAQRLLSSTDDSLSAIAARVGFGRQGSFSEAFKRAFGMTPREYRAISVRDRV